MKLKDGMYRDDAKDLIVLFNNWSDWIEPGQLNNLTKHPRDNFDVWLTKPNYLLVPEFLK